MENDEDKITKISDHLSTLGTGKKRIFSVYFSKDYCLNNCLTFDECKELIKSINPDLLLSNYKFIEYIFERAKIEALHKNKFHEEIIQFDKFINKFENEIIEEVNKFKEKMLDEFNHSIKCHLTSNQFIKDYDNGCFSDENNFKGAINSYVLNICSNSIQDLKEFQTYIDNNTYYQDSIKKISNLRDYIITFLNGKESENSETDSKIKSLIMNIEEISKNCREKWDFYKETSSKYLEAIPNSYIVSLQKVEQLLLTDFIKSNDKIQEEIKLSQENQLLEDKLTKESNKNYYLRNIFQNQYIMIYKSFLQNSPRINSRFLQFYEKLAKEKLAYFSKIINNQEENDFLQNCINQIYPNKKFSFEVLYHYDENGNFVPLSQLLINLNNQSQFFILCQSELGKRFGGFINSTFKNNSNYIRDDKCFLFTIDKKIQIKCLKPEKAFIANSSYLQFGEDDFILDNDFKFYFQPGENLKKGKDIKGGIYEYKCEFQNYGYPYGFGQFSIGPLYQPAQQVSKLKILEIIKVNHL